MNLPFLRYFKKDKTEESNVAVAVAVAPRPPTPIDKPASERFGKTVMPNSSRVVGLAPASDFTMVPPIGNPASSALAGPRKISLGESGALAVGSKGAPAGGAPAGVAERTIALRLSDLVPHLPEGVLGSTMTDPEHRVLLKASEVERGMANGRPVASLRSIYQQAPELFAAAVAEEDKREVALPFAKVLEQFTSFQVRPDQLSEQEVPEVETPFLKMAKEDSERHGKPAAPIPASTVSEMHTPVAEAEPVMSVPSPVPVETKAEAPVESVAPAAKTIRPLRLPLPDEAAAAPVAHALPETSPPPIAPKLSPNGTGVPASERVPASSGPPVPTQLPSPFAPPAPVRIPFKISPPSNDLREARPAPATPAPAPKLKVGFASDGPRVRLSLRNVLREISPFQLSAATDAVPESAELEVPFSIIEPQLSLGRISISPAQFEAALPEEFRALLKLEEPDLPVALPLEEVLRKLPNESLQLRGDQEEPEVSELFETPFSAKAAEDAKRLKVTTGPIARPGVEAAVPAASPVPPAASPTPEIPALEAALPLRPTRPPLQPSGLQESSIPQTTTAPVARSPLQELFETDETLDAKAVVAHASRLPGISACAIVFSDGLSLAGNIPPEYGAEGLCALAPSIVKRINEQMDGTNFGELTGITLFCAKTPVSFFAHDNICLAALHSTGEIAAENRTRLNRAVRALAQMYSQPA